MAQQADTEFAPGNTGNLNAFTIANRWYPDHVQPGGSSVAAGVFIRAIERRHEPGRRFWEPVYGRGASIQLHHQQQQPDVRF